MSSNSALATLLMDMPLVFAILEDKKFYVEFQTEDLILNLPNQDLRGLLERKLRTNTHQVCTSVLYGDNNTAIKWFCICSMITYDNKPQIHVHNYPELLSTNIINVTVKCGSKNKTVSGCRTCIYVFERRCSVIAEGISISGQRTQISGHTNESVVHPLNASIVKAKLDEMSLNDVEANIVFKSATKLELPTLKCYTHDVDKKVVKDKSFAVALDKTAEF